MVLVKRRGAILLYVLIALFVVTLAGAVVLSYNDAIARAERVEAQLDEVKRIGEAQEAKTKAEIDRQRKVSDATIKSLQSRYAGLNAKYARLRQSPPGPGGMPTIPDTARPTDDAARDQRLLDVLQYADQQTQQLIELQDWVKSQDTQVSPKP